jgi:hypothetical protein
LRSPTCAAAANTGAIGTMPGARANKQNVFDDFIAAGEYLIAEGDHAQGRACHPGRIERRLLVGAVVNQRPDLFAAANRASRRDGHAALRSLHRRALLGG